MLRAKTLGRWLAYANGANPLVMLEQDVNITMSLGASTVIIADIQLSMVLPLEK